MGRLTSTLTVVVLGAVVAGCTAIAGFTAWKSSQPGGERELRIAHVLPSTHPVHLGLERFAERLKEISHGRLTAVVFAGGQIGSDTQYVEKLQTGTLDGAVVSSAVIGGFVPEFRVFSLPFLFKNDAQRWRTLDGRVGTDLLHHAIQKRPDGSGSGLFGLAFYESGSRSFYAKQPVSTPDDIRARKWRVMNDPIAMDMVESLGGSPAPIAAAELYSALAQGVVDGAENNPPSFVRGRHYEMCRHYLLTEHTSIPDVLLLGEKTRSHLTHEEQGWIEQAAKDSAAYQRELWTRATAEALDELRANGVEILQADRSHFADITRPVLDSQMKGPLGPWVHRILSTP